MSQHKKVKEIQEVLGLIYFAKLLLKSGYKRIIS